MFPTFNSLKACVQKHSSKIILDSAFPAEALDLVVDQFGQGTHGQEERLSSFLNRLSTSGSCYTELFEGNGKDAPFSGAYGAVYIEDENYNRDLQCGTIARKFFMDDDGSLNVYNKTKPTFDALLNLMNYVLFKAILLEAEELGIVPKGVEEYVLPINEFFVAEAEEGFQIGFTSRYIRTNWKKADARMKKRTVAHINNFTRALNNLREFGVYLTHGDLKMGNIVYDYMTEKPYVIDFGISTIRIDYEDGSFNNSITDFVNFEATGREFGATDIAMFGYCYNRTFNNPGSVGEFANIFRGIFDDDFFNNLVEYCNKADENYLPLNVKINRTMYNLIYKYISVYFQTHDFNYKNVASSIFTRL